MVERLEAVIEAARKLPEAEQEALAAEWEDILEERRWAEALQDPHDLVLDRLLDEAEQQIAAGEVYDLDDRP